MKHGPNYSYTEDRTLSGDAPILPDLLSQIPPEEEIASVTADGAYDTRKCHDAIHCPAGYVYMHERGRPWCECRHIHTTTLKIEPTAAVAAIAAAPQSVTRTAPRMIPAPPAFAPKPPNIAKKTIVEIAT